MKDSPSAITPLDCRRENLAHEEAFHAALQRVLDSGRYLLGSELASFEREFAAHCDTVGSAGVGCGLDALTLMLKASRSLGLLSAGDEVLVPANSFVASALAVRSAGLQLRFCDVDERTALVTPDSLGPYRTPRTPAVLAVHLYGRPCAMSELQDYARSHDLLVFADAAQAVASYCGDQHVACLGEAAAFSFYPGKNLGALGDGGAVASNNSDLLQAIGRLRNYGLQDKHSAVEEGVNSRLDEFQAAVLRLKLSRLPVEQDRRRSIARRYRDGIMRPGLQLSEGPGEVDGHGWHHFVVRTPHREAFLAALGRAGVNCGVHYPVPLNRQVCFQSLPPQTLPAAERWCAEVFSLPVGPSMPDEDVQRVVDAVNTVHLSPP